MSKRRRMLGLYLLEALVTVVIVAPITISLVLRNRPADSVAAFPPMDQMVAEEAPSILTDRESLDLGEGWREDFHDLSNWAQLAGPAASVTDESLLLRAGPTGGSIICQRRPIYYASTEILLAVRSNAGGALSVGVASASSGPQSEIAGDVISPLPSDGLQLDIGFSNASKGGLTWMRDGRKLLIVVTQEKGLPPASFAEVALRLTAERCAVLINGQSAGELHNPWTPGSYRLYLAASEADTVVDYVAMRPNPDLSGAMSRKSSPRPIALLGCLSLPGL